MFTENQVISVCALNHLARNILEDGLVGLWVSGEVSNLTRAASGHYYFALKDSLAQVRCALFKARAETLGFTLKEGEEIELTGKITLYEARGEFQIVVNQCRQTGAGKLYAAYEALKMRLQSEGLFNADQKKKLPYFPKSIGIVTSASAAALRDVVMTLRRRMSNVAVILYPTAVQGKGSEMAIAQAIATANQRKEVEVLIVCRGGGSIEDLWSFNEEVVVRAIAHSQLPIISGVGHETDFTLCDFVADVRASTPTAAAEMAVPDRQMLQQDLNRLAENLYQAMQHRFQAAMQQLDRIDRHVRHPKEQLQIKQKQLNMAAENFTLCFTKKLSNAHNLLARYHHEIRAYRPQIQLFKQQLNHEESKLIQSKERIIHDKYLALSRLNDVLLAVSPQNILARGFTVVRDSRGKIIRSAHSLRLGQKIQLDFAESSTQAIISKESAQKDLFD